MSKPLRAFALKPGAGVSVRNPVGGQLVFKLRGEQSGGAMTVFESVVAPDEGPPLHIHTHNDEWLYVLEGEMRVRLGDDVGPAQTGSFAFIPRGVAHNWQNVGPVKAVVLAMLTPSGLEQFFERYAELPENAANVQSLRALAPDAGMTVVGPPLAESHPIHESTKTHAAGHPDAVAATPRAGTLASTGGARLLFGHRPDRDDRRCRRAGRGTCV